jgi:hypothetical protein
MKTRLTNLVVLGICTLGLVLAGAAIVEAASVTVSATAPTVNGDDIANLGGTEIKGNDLSGPQVDVWSLDQANPIGQKFTTGSNAEGYNLYAVTVRQTQGDPIDFGGGNIWNWDYLQKGPFNMEVGPVAGTTITPIASEDSQAGLVDIYHGNYVTFTFTTPVHLNPGTLYGFDMAGSLDNVTGGFRTANVANGQSTGGAFICGNGSTVGRFDSAITDLTGLDRVFHLDMVAGPAVPEPSAILMCVMGMFGLLAYAWRKRK